ncbi:GNAT family N-acetyltransferase [Roseovarius sp. SK2]|uniref:GNAT family N-acetyltransferase n=1 Tax=unclassified Roseovarius TaxID=2614913 RepID=UPI00237B8386|nr:MULTISPECIES: GNAT family N-acetyltransferase [unclassified Roseovarius]MDD9728233.1 GNAT family N-acetyltransferase [Roseovarius sp. SK2]
MAKSPKVMNRLRELRRARGLTQQNLAELLGVSRQTINAIEKGRYEPSLPVAFDIANAFASRIEDIFRPARDAHDNSPWSNLMIPIPKQLSAGQTVIRPHVASDLAAFEQFLTHPTATQFMAFTPEQKSSAGAAAMMDAVIGSYASNHPICSLTIADDSTGEYLGSIGAAEAGDHAAEVFITVMPDTQRRGIAKTSLPVFVDHLFSTSAVTQLIADVVKDNTAAVRLFDQAGFLNTGPIERAAEDGALGHRDMAGLRFVMTRADFNKLRAS